MEEIQLKVKNMRCESCTKIIQMELHDYGFKDKLLSVELTDSRHHIGLVRLTELNRTERQKAKEVIEKAGEYVVLN